MMQSLSFIQNIRMRIFGAIFGAPEPDDENKSAHRDRDNILLESYKAIYFPIPKIASSSLKVVFSELLDAAPRRSDRPISSPHNRDFPFASYETLDTEYADYFKFAIVRNPFSRILSCYRNKIRKEMDGKKRPSFSDGVHKPFLRYGNEIGYRRYKKFHREMSLDDFLEAISEIPDHKADRHFRSQASYLCGPDGRLFPNHLVKFENLAQDLAYIFNKIGVPPTNLPHLVDSGTGNSYREHFSERGKQLVYERYARDFELFGYEF